VNKIPTKPVIDWAVLFRQYRSEKQISQPELARLIGYSVSMIESVEQGRRGIPANKQQNILEMMGY